MSGKVKVWEFIPLPDQTKFRTGWPVHGTHSEKSPVLGHLPRHHNFQVTGFHGAWVRAQLPNGLTGWTMATYRGARYPLLHLLPSPRASKEHSPYHLTLSHPGSYIPLLVSWVRNRTGGNVHEATPKTTMKCWKSGEHSCD